MLIHQAEFWQLKSTQLAIENCKVDRPGCWNRWLKQWQYGTQKWHQAPMVFSPPPVEKEKTQTISQSERLIGDFGSQWLPQKSHPPCQTRPCEKTGSAAVRFQKIQVPMRKPKRTLKHGTLTFCVVAIGDTCSKNKAHFTAYVGSPSGIGITLYHRWTRPGSQWAPGSKNLPSNTSSKIRAPRWSILQMRNTHCWYFGCGPLPVTVANESNEGSKDPPTNKICNNNGKGHCHWEGATPNWYFRNTANWLGSTRNQLMALDIYGYLPCQRRNFVYEQCDCDIMVFQLMLCHDFQGRVKTWSTWKSSYGSVPKMMNPPNPAGITVLVNIWRTIL